MGATLLEWAGLGRLICGFAGHWAEINWLLRKVHNDGVMQCVAPRQAKFDPEAGMKVRFV